MNSDNLSDDDLLRLIYSERARDLILNLTPDLEKRITDPATLTIIIKNVQILMVVNEMTTLLQVSKKSGVDRAQISKFLAGQGGISVKSFCDLARALLVTPRQLATADLSKVITEHLSSLEQTNTTS